MGSEMCIRDRFEGLGCMEGLCHLEVDQTVRPVIHPPVALRDRLKEELDKLVGEEILTPVT